MILISGCLIGLNCTYSGGNKLHPKFIERMKNEDFLPICPEQMGGLPTPRAPAETINGTGEDVLDGKAKVLTKSGDDVTQAFVRGANEALYLANLLEAELIILKQNSPSCGCGHIYDGTFTGTIREGNGVTTAILLRNKFRVLAG